MIELFIIALLAGSLSELQSELSNETKYWNELVDYIKVHNISDPVPNSITLEDLEAYVGDYIQTCVNNNTKVIHEVTEEDKIRLGLTEDLTEKC